MLRELVHRVMGIGMGTGLLLVLGSADVAYAEFTCSISVPEGMVGKSREAVVSYAGGGL